MMGNLGTSRLCSLALVAVAAAAMVGSDAMAWSHGSWGSSGSYGSYGSSASYGSYGSCACYGSYGSDGGGLFARMRANREARRAARSCYGCYGSYGCAGCYGSYGSSASYGCCGSTGGVIYSEPTEAPVEAPTPAEEPTPAEAPAPDQSAGIFSDSATITVSLPADAKVFVNGQATSSTGSSRNYVSRGLEAGKIYAYKLRVEFSEGPAQDKLLKLRAGDNLAISFGSEDQSQVTAAAPVETELKLDVPENAKVFLSGAATEQTGQVRSYITQHLAAGESWAGYTVRVELERDGLSLVQERNLTVIGGESYELAFDFDAEETTLAQLAK